MFYISCFITLRVAIFNIWCDIKYAILTVNKKAVDSFSNCFILFVLETVVFLISEKYDQAFWKKKNFFIELLVLEMFYKKNNGKNF